MTGPLIQVGASGAAKLNKSQSAKLNAAGRAEVTIGPVPAGARWLVTRMTVFVTGSNNPMPVCFVYEGTEMPSNLVDSTYTGGQDVSDFGTPWPLEEQESLLFVWTGGTAGTTATARILGTQEPA